ncbi:hypothetical protein BDZ89DRAFT_1113339 [Hymenopellis radicata]|nr:hypothetical protein BDZ89DRAFT_1113339 [Hymenopellis radicata]
MSGSRNILRRLNKLLARMSQYLEALIIYSAEGYGYSTHLLELYTTTLERISNDSSLRHLELNLVIHIISTVRMPSVPRNVWLDLDDALTTNALQEILESVVLNVFVMPKALFIDESLVTEQFMMDVENWVIGECLPVTRMARLEPIPLTSRNSITASEKVGEVSFLVQKFQKIFSLPSVKRL